MDRSYTVSNALESRAESMTSAVEESTAQNWPFVTTPHFEIRGENTRLETRTEIFLYAPLLEFQTEKDAWAPYSIQNEAWLQESYQRAINTLGQEEGQYMDSSTKSFPDAVYRVEGDWNLVPENSPGPWMPIWQVSPPPPDPYPINFNMLSSPDMAQLVDYVRDKQVPVMSDRLVRHPLFARLVAQYDTITPEHDHADHGYDSDHDHEAHGHRRHLQSDAGTYNESYVNEGGHTFVFYPVFDNFVEAAHRRKLTGVFLSLIR